MMAAAKLSSLNDKESEMRASAKPKAKSRPLAAPRPPQDAMEGAGLAPNAMWLEVTDECCVWPFKTWEPNVALEAHTIGGNTLQLHVKASHNCGISDYGLTIRITQIGTGVTWVLRIDKAIDPAKDVDDTLTFGQAGRNKLPVKSLDGWHVWITGSATSKCGTSKDFKPVEFDVKFV
jgi:hypothetical protein